MAVHEFNLGAAALAHVLAHRGDLGVRALLRLRKQDLFDHRHRAGVAFAGESEFFRVGADHRLERIAGRLADAHRFARQADEQAPERVGLHDAIA